MIFTGSLLTFGLLTALFACLFGLLLSCSTRLLYALPRVDNLPQDQWSCHKGNEKRAGTPEGGPIVGIPSCPLGQAACVATTIQASGTSRVRVTAPARILMTIFSMAGG